MPTAKLATARAAAAAGTVMVVSSTAIDRLEDVAAARRGAAKWWQLYVFADRGATGEMLARVASAGYEAICWTVDFPVNGLRHRDTRSGFVMPIGTAVDAIWSSTRTWTGTTSRGSADRSPGFPSW